MPQPTSARRYAEAAFEIAERDDAVEAWQEQLRRAAEIVGDPDLARGLQNPAEPFDRRREILETALGGDVQPGVRNLLFLLLRRRRIEQVPALSTEFRQLVNRRAGIVEAVATSAAALEPAEVAALRESLERRTGGRIELTLEVDPALLGGVVVRMGDRLIDGSVRGRLERLRTRLHSTGAL